MESDDVEVILVPNPRVPRMCIFMLDLGGWQSTVNFTVNREWVHDIFLQLVYRFGRMKEVKVDPSARVAGKLYPPNIHYLYPREKVRVLSALRFIKKKDSKKLLELFEASEMEKFEEEALVLGVSEGLGRARGG